MLVNVLAVSYNGLPSGIFILLKLKKIENKMEQQNKKIVSDVFQQVTDNLSNIKEAEETAFMFFSVNQSPDKEGRSELRACYKGCKGAAIKLLASAMQKSPDIKEIVTRSLKQVDADAKSEDMPEDLRNFLRSLSKMANASIPRNDGFDIRKNMN